MNKDYKLYVHIAPNGKKYYGITKQKPEQRWRNGRGYQYNQHFTSAIKKYGWDNIQHIVLHEGLDEDEAKELEQYMIQWYGTANRDYGYNNSLGGEGASGIIQSEETKKKRAESNRGQRRSEETKRRMSEAQKGKCAGEKHPMYGKHLPEETRKKISEAHKGMRHTEETKRKLSEINKGKQISEETRRKMSRPGKNNPAAKSVICITTNRVFDTVTDGANCYNTFCSSIAKCCHDKLKSSGKLPDGTKLVWRYIDIIEL